MSLHLADSSGGLERWRLRLVIYDHEVSYPRETTEQVADESSFIRIPEVEQDLTNEKVPCFALESNLVDHSTQLERHEAVIAIRSVPETETQTEHNISSSGLNLHGEPIVPDPFTLEKLLKAQKENKFFREHVELVSDLQSCLDYDSYDILVR